MRVAEIFGSLAELPRWLVWREEMRGSRKTKVPYDPKNPTGMASSTDPTTWSSLSVAAQVAERGFSGVGIVLGEGIGGIDLDGCRDPETGEVAPWAQTIIHGFASYAEVSPSGTGVKIFAAGAPPDLPASTIPIKRALYNGDKRPAIECYVKSRYFAVTGAILDGVPDEIRDCSETGGPWDRMVRLLRERASTSTELTLVPPTGAAVMSDDLSKALADNRKLRDLWNQGVAGGTDRSRNDAALATSLAARGFSDEDIEAAIRNYTLGQIGQAALAGKDAERRVSRLLGLAHEARERAPHGGAQHDEETPFDLSHDSMALDMGALWKPDMRHVAQWGKWFQWDGSVWVRDDVLYHLTRTREYLRERAQQLEGWAAGKAEVMKAKDAERIVQSAGGQAKSLRNSATIAAVAMLARSNPNQAAGVDQWDADPWVMGTPGAIIDLRTGALHPPERERYITKSTSVTPAARGTPAPLWQRFLERVTANDLALQNYLQRFFGYSLTGLITEHAFAFGWGTGANGKSVCIGTVQSILGDYALEIPTEMLMVTKNERHPTELARLRGVRLAIGSETEEGTRWAEARIKSLTGGDRIVARFMREDFFEFPPQFKLFVIGNHRPSLRGVDEAMRRRLHFVPFVVKIPEDERDRELRNKLREEWPAILRWMIDGCLTWQREGLNAPPAVRAATEAYLSAEDSVSQWMDESVDRDLGAWEPSGSLFASWKRWAETAGEYAGSQKRFAQTLEERGLTPKRQASTGIRGYIGARLIAADNGRDYTGGG